MSKNRPFTVDHVGSFLRPQSIKEARKKVQEGLLSKEELRAIEDQEIKKLVEDQRFFLPLSSRFFQLMLINDFFGRH